MDDTDVKIARISDRHPRESLRPGTRIEAEHAEEFVPEQRVPEGPRGLLIQTQGHVAVAQGHIAVTQSHVDGTHTL